MTTALLDGWWMRDTDRETHKITVDGATACGQDGTSWRKVPAGTPHCPDCEGAS